VIISAIAPSSKVCMLSLLMSVCRNASRMFDTITYLFSFASLVQESIIASIDTVGELVYALSVFGLLDAHLHIPMLHRILLLGTFGVARLFLFCHMTYLLCSNFIYVRPSSTICPIAIVYHVYFRITIICYDFSIQICEPFLLFVWMLQLVCVQYLLHLWA